MEAKSGRNEMERFHQLYLTCMAGAAIFWVMSIHLFIRTDIKGVIGFFMRSRGNGKICKIQEKERAESAFCMEREILIVHTEEVI
jgi:hypothetical protein